MDLNRIWKVYRVYRFTGFTGFKKDLNLKGSKFLGFQKLFFSGPLIFPWEYAFEKEPLNGTKTKIVGVAPIHCTPQHAQEEVIT